MCCCRLSPDATACLSALASAPLPHAGLAHLSRLTQLSSLCLWNCLHVSDEGLAALSGASLLTEISLRGCQQLSDACLAHLAPLTALRRLDARACEHLRGEELTRLSRLHALRELDLRGAYGLVDPGVESLGRALRGLTRLNLQECWQVTERGLAHLSGERAVRPGVGVPGPQPVLNSGPNACRAMPCHVPISRDALIWWSSASLHTAPTWPAAQRIPSPAPDALPCCASAAAAADRQVQACRAW